MRFRVLLNVFVAVILSLAFPCACFAAACCGGGFATPSLIVGDDQAQVTSSFTHSQILDDVDSGGIWYPRGDSESGETLRLEGAHIAWDRFQFGGAFPLVQRNRSGHSSTGLGDLSATMGYEVLPEWDYSAWRPRGLGFLQLTAPTGRSVNESTAAYQLDARGRGFWSLAVGTILTKTWSKVDLFTTFDVHRSLARDYRNDQSEGTLHPGWGGNVAAGGGYSLTNWRMGGGLTWTYEDAVDVTGQNTSNGAPQRFATAMLSASYLFDRAWSASLSYSDQTWFGEPTNTSLGRSASLLVQKRWER